MKLITEKQTEAVDKCLVHNIPFALFALPGEKECRFFASSPDKNGECHAFDDDNASGTGSHTFFIGYFNGDEPYMAGVRADYNEDSVLETLKGKERFDATETRPARISTRRESYSVAFTKMKQRLRSIGGKVVLSRHEAIFSSRPIMEVTAEYMESDPEAFRYMCYTPETGVWIGVTPELLLEAGGESDTFHTMALAGTLPADSTCEWDDKNIVEHRYVSDYISGKLEQLGLKVDVSPVKELYTGAVKHLCTSISATGTADPMEIVDMLSPTPAVAGIPVDMAIAEIDTYENHRRRCYAGVVGVKSGNSIHAYVNLRCAFAAFANLDGKDGWLYNLYAGGGLVRESVEETEWEETIAKTTVLSSIIRAGEDTTVADYDLRDAKFIQYGIDLPF